MSKAEKYHVLGFHLEHPLLVVKMQQSPSLSHERWGLESHTQGRITEMIDGELEDAKRGNA